MHATSNPIARRAAARPLSTERRLASVGALAWLLTPLAPLPEAPGFGTVAHVFLLLPVVIAPVAVGLLACWTGPSPVRTAARAVQFPGAALLLLASALPAGPVAGALCAPWLAFALLLAAAAVRPNPRDRRRTASASLVAAHAFLVIGAGWFLSSRLGVGPSSLSPPKVLLAAVHFHFSGFALHLLFEGAVRLLPPGSRAARILRAVAVASILGLLGIAAGNLASLPALRLAAVLVVATCTVGLAAATGLSSSSVPRGEARRLLRISAGSGIVAMVLAGVYGVGEYSGTAPIGLAAMAVLHGLVNAVGFVLCGLVGHRRARRSDTGAPDARTGPPGSPTG